MTFTRSRMAAIFALQAAFTLPSVAHAQDAAPAVVPVNPPPSSPPQGSLSPAPAAAPPAPAEPAQAQEEPAPPADAPVSAFGRPRRHVVTLPPRARPTQPPADEPRPDDGLMGSHQTHFYGMLGYRLTRVSNDGYQPFARDQAFHQLSIVLGRVLFAADALSFGLGAGWDYGASDADARGSDTSLNVHRLSLVPELRYHLLRRLYAFGRLGAGLSFVHTELSDGVVGRAFTSDRVAFSVDPNVGVAFEVVGEPAGGSRQPRVWVALDGGYLFTTESKVALTNESGAPARSEERAFADLGLSGLSGRLSAALTF